MEHRQASSEYERPHSSIIVVAPTVEALMNPSECNQLWGDLEIASQADERARCAKVLEKLFSSLPNPNTSLEAAIDQKMISPKLAGDAYNELSKVLSDPEYKRLLLYLPFDILPRSSWSTEDEALNQALSQFKDSYKHAWYSLLTIHDVRANFVDGDVIEVEYREGDLPRVVKAAHLTPALLSKGLVSYREIEELLQISDDPILQESLQEALTAYGLLANQGDDQTHAKDQQTKSLPIMPTTKERQIWLNYQQDEARLQKKAQKISSFIITDDLQPTSIEWTDTQDESSYRAIAEGIYNAIETSAWQDIGHAKATYSKYKPMLDQLWREAESPSIKEQTAKTFRRLYRLGIIDREELDQLGISLPTLKGPFSENLNLIAEDIDRLKRISSAIGSTPLLNATLYPAILVNGSRLKGYAEHISDFDTSVFVRPGADEADKERMRELVYPLFAREGYNHEPSEFWLQEENEKLKVRSFPDFDKRRADSYWAHTLFGSAWVGDETEIQLIQKRLLPTYFENSEENIHGRKARELYIEELERDRLQYRLLHKGYSRHYPTYPRDLWTHQSEIDGDAAFWDPGYRQLATQIYLNSVFLPKLHS